MQTLPSATPAPHGDVPPPSAQQLRQTLDPAGPGDSPPLPKAQVDALNDGIADQQSRRSHRPAIVFAALLVLGALVLNLTWVVCTVLNGYQGAIAPDRSTLAPVSAPEQPIAGQARATPSTRADNHSPIAPPQGEARHLTLREAMTPLVALVSILTLATVFILGTMLKAAFATPQHGHRDPGKNDPSSLPLTEALKALLDSLKGIFGKG